MKKYLIFFLIFTLVFSNIGLVFANSFTEKDIENIVEEYLKGNITDKELEQYLKKEFSTAPTGIKPYLTNEKEMLVQKSSNPLSWTWRAFKDALRVAGISKSDILRAMKNSPSKALKDFYKKYKYCSDDKFFSALKVLLGTNTLWKAVKFVIYIVKFEILP